ncbi:phospholipid-translocating P-type ATPase [Phellopilus nigrolimitatus]|nr:phospholipid-translocating P-type ATPase [Phellopilus nigrolimitatus]
MATRPKARPRPRKRAGGAASWYARVASFNVESLFSKSNEPGPPRAVFVNEDLPQDYYDAKGRIKKEHVYNVNQVITSKYTFITFLPRNLLEQFRRIANIFFAVIAILQFFSEFSTISPGLVILPLLIVLAITAVKDGYEDVKRHQSDRHINLSHVRVLNGGNWTNPNVMASKGRTMTQLFSLLGCFGRKGGRKSKAGSQAAAMEVELVERGNFPGLHQDVPVDDDPTMHGIEFDEHGPHSPVQERPHPVLGVYHGPGNRKRDPAQPHWKRTTWEDVRVGDCVKIVNEESFPADILICATSEEENVCYVETKNLDGETNLKSRNAVPALTHLRSAEACADSARSRFRIDLDRPDPNMYRLHGAVVTKEGKEPLDLQTVLLRGTVLKNTEWVIGVVMFTGKDTKILLNAGGTPSKRSRVERQMNPQVFINLVLLAVMAIICGVVDSILETRDYPLGAPWLVGDTQPNDNPKINGVITAVFALITFQNIVPISLYISIEVVRTLQAAFIYFDKQIWYAKTNQPTMARSWNLSDDLGQVEYVFSDKTGTLTQNAMIFRNCSIGGKVYKGEFEADQEEKDKESSQVNVRFSAAASDATSPGSSTMREDKRTSPPPDPAEAPGVQLPSKVLAHFRNAALEQDLADAVHAGAGSDGAAHARTLNGFFSVLALCHTVLAVVDPETGRVEYRAQSPDEAALVQAAADAGFVFRGRDKETLKLQTPFSDELEHYELLNVLDFTSARKRMSVILRKADDEDGRIFLLTKGADNVIFERLKPGVNDELREITEHHLDEFAGEGLRTLTLAYKVIPEDYYDEWSERYAEATVSLQNREENVAVVCNEIEGDLRLLGATAIEDRLQDGVPETIADLKLAGIKVWVATGDKLETAIAIGYSTNLIASESNLIVVRGGERDDLSIFDQMYNAVEEFFPEANIIEEEELDINEKHESARRSTGEGDGIGTPLRRVNTGVSSIVGSNNGERPGGFVLVIEGTALSHAFADDDSKRLLLRLAIQCEAVVCCRVSPLQKALVVKLVKEGIGAMTLAIGDGANDVSMIQAADVGVGISGEEGLQAVNSSDYAIAQFRFLKRLLLVHGHYSYSRNANMIVNFFYKNIICIGILFWFQIYCGWSSQYVFEYTYLLFWNVFWSLCPVIAIGLFDRIVDDDILMEVPELYHYGRDGYWFGNKTFAIFMFDAVYQSVIIFFIVNYSYFMPTSRPDGYDVAQYEFATTMALAAVMCANMFNGLNTAAWTGWVFFAVSIGVVLVWAYTAIYSLISPGWFYVPVFGNDHYLFHSAIFWLALPLVICLSLAPRYISKAYMFNFAPTEIDKMRLLRKNHPNRNTREALLGEPPRTKSHPQQDTLAAYAGSRPSLVDRRGSRTDMATGLRGVHRGFDFMQEEGGVAIQRIQTNLSERRQLQLDERARTPGGSHLRLFSLGRSRKQRQQPSKSE